MGELITFKKFLEFRRAADQAKEMAQQHKTQTGVQRTDLGWEVLVPPSVAVLASAAWHVEEPNEQDLADTGDFDAEEYYQDEELELVMEELAKDQEDWARSEEEGWFYSDGDDD